MTVLDLKPHSGGNNDEAADKLRSVSVYQTMSTTAKLRLLSESALDSVLPWHLERGTAYHCISSGDVDALSYIRHIVKGQRVRYLIVSTWCLARADAEEMREWVRRGDVDRVDVYVGEIFKDGYRGCRDVLDETARMCGGRVARFRNHSKVSVIYGDEYEAVIESSANLDTNPRTEQTCITVGADGLADFYKSYFDGIRSYDGGYDDWTQWTR